MSGWCERCGGPIRPPQIDHSTRDGCRLCWLMERPPEPTRGAPVERSDPRGTVTVFDFDGRDAWASRWLPPGQRELRPTQVSTSRSYYAWLRDVRDRQEMGEWASNSDRRALLRRVRAAAIKATQSDAGRTPRVAHRGLARGDG